MNKRDQAMLALARECWRLAWRIWELCDALDDAEMDKGVGREAAAAAIEHARAPREPNG